jgi:Outer membrane lipoprotein-sorting protein
MSATILHFPARRRLLTLLGMAIVTIFTAVAPEDARAEEPEPEAEDIQNLVKMSYVRQDNKFKGKLRNDANGTEVPFRLTMLDKTIRFSFDAPAQIINLDINDKAYRLYETVKGSKATVPAKKYSEAIRGTDVTYEDLSLRFLYWPNPVRLENETVKHRACWKLRMINPDASGAYSTAFIWVDKKSGALMKMEGYDREGKKIKAYEVVSGMKVENGWMLKELRVETYSASTAKRVGITYMELSDE